MAFIRTVAGDIAPETLGICLPHEHLLASPPEPYATQDSDLVIQDVDAARAALLAWQAAGGGAVVEMTPLDYNRRVPDLQTLSQQTGVHIIAVTGYLKEKFSQSFVQDQTAAQIATQMIADIVEGVDGSSARCGVIKASSSLNIITPTEQKIFRAAAQAQRATGALISTHTEAGTMALEQIALLQAEGVEPSRMLIGHLDRNLDWELHQRIAATGVYMGFDQIGKPKYDPDERRIEIIMNLIAAGHARQILLSRDLARKSYFPAYGYSSQPGFVYLLETFAPLLRSAGLDEALVNLLLIENPAQALSIG